MKRVWRLLILLVGLPILRLVAPLRAVEPAPAPAGSSAVVAGDDRKTLLQLEQDWGNAVVRHDAESIDRIEADSYVYTDWNGAVAHKAEDLANARAGDCKIAAFKLSDMKVQLRGESAIVTGQTTLIGSDHSGSLTGTYRWTDVFVRGANGLWQVTASQATTVSRAEEPASAAASAALPMESPTESPAASPPDTED